MSHCFYHSVSSSRKFGGRWEDYIKIHSWFDHTKAHLGDNRHRMVFHNSFGIFVCEQVFGEILTRESDGQVVPIRLIGEQHVLEDLGKIPSLEECLRNLPKESWMSRAARKLSTELKLTAGETEHATISQE